MQSPPGVAVQRCGGVLLIELVLSRLCQGNQAQHLGKAMACQALALPCYITSGDLTSFQICGAREGRQAGRLAAR
jgi:hypothetical protein